MSDIKAARTALLARILEGDGTASRAQRRAAFDNAADGSAWRTMVQKTAVQSCRITDDDISAARSAGLSEDQIFELVVCAAVGQATRQHEAALMALEGANHATRDS
jgi:transcriptional regulator of nitric oxide reductase